MPDAIDDFIKLSQDQQITMLQRLAPDKQAKLLDQVKERNTSFNTKLTRVNSPEFQKNHPILSAASDFGGGAINAVEQVAAHPIESVKGTVQTLGDVGNVVWPDATSPEEAAASKGRLKSQVDFFKEHPAYSLGGLAASYDVGKLAGKVVTPLSRKVAALPETFRKGVQASVGAGERPIRAAVVKEADDAAVAAQKVADANKEAEEGTLKDRGKVDEANKKAKLEAAKKNTEAARTNAAETEEVKAKNREAVRAQEKIEPTQQKLESASSELRGRVETAREKALKVGNEKYSTVNEELSPLSADMESVHNAYQEATGAIGDVQTEPPLLKRLGESIGRGDALTYKDMQGVYSELGKELSKGTLPGNVYHAYDLLHEGVGEEMQRLADTKPATVDFIEKSGKVDLAATKAKLPPVKTGYTRLFRSESPTVGFRDVFDADKLNSMNPEFAERPEGKSYTPDLGYADYYRQSYGPNAKTSFIDVPDGVLRESKLGPGEYVVKTPEKYQVTMGAQLLDARNYWRRMKQTFGKKYSPTDAATAATEKSSPDFARQEAQKNQLRLLGSFDPEIPKVDEHIQNLQKGLGALPKPAPIRKVVEPLPAKPEPVVASRASYPEPRDVKPIEVPEVSTKEMRQDILDKWTKGETTLSKWQVRSLLTGGLGSVIGFALGETAGAGRLGAEIGGAASYVFGPSAVAGLLEKPAIREWITRPPAGELESLRKLPNADKIKIIDVLRPTVEAAKAKGIKVDPALIGLISGSHLRHPVLSSKSPVQ